MESVSRLEHITIHSKQSMQHLIPVHDNDVLTYFEV